MADDQLFERRMEPETDGNEVCEVPGADPERVSRGRKLLLSEDSYAQLAEVFRSLADPSRAKIVYSLLQQELCTCDLAAITCLSEPAVSQHLRVLRSLRLVRTRRQGKRVFYLLDDAHVRSLLAMALDHIGHAGWRLERGPATERAIS
jgi:DNA-binding transcriptional ArsR family regulator